MKNISIDDFSHCKRKRYFSILVDNDTRKRLEVVSSRQQPEVVEILRKFKNVETITRDFSKTYKAAISEALPNAKQIADRFHILKNLTEDILARFPCIAVKGKESAGKRNIGFIILKKVT